MDEVIGGAIYYICATFFMSILLKLDFSNKKKVAMSILSFFVGFAVIITFCIIIGIDAILNLMPLVVLLPLYFAFWFVSIHKGLKLLFVLLTSSILILMPALLAVGVSFVINNETLMTAVALALIAAIIVLLIKVFRKQLYFIMEYVDSKRYWLSISIIPILYNLAIYVLGIYNSKAENGATPIWFQLILMAITVSAYVLIFQTFNQIKRKSERDNENQLMDIQMKSAIETIEQMQESQNQAAIYRHDLRHHIQMLYSYLNNKDYDVLENYLKGLQNDLDEMVLVDYCDNYSINLLLSAYSKKSANIGADFIVNANIPKKVEVNEKDICVVLSNALENALNATMKSDEKKIIFECKPNNNKLAISIKNTYFGEIEFEQGLPKNKKENHGFGTQSISTIAKKYDGMYFFEEKNGMFCFNLVI